MKYLWTVVVQTAAGENRRVNVTENLYSDALIKACEMMGLKPGTDGSVVTCINRGEQVHG